MKVESEKIKVIEKERKTGTGKTGNPYDFTIIYGNLTNGIQQQIIIPNELESKIQKGDTISIVYEEYRGKIYAREIKK